MAIEFGLRVGDWLVPLLAICIAASSAVHILLFKLNSRAAVGWLALVVLFPFLGSGLYWLFGVNRMGTKGLVGIEPRQRTLSSVKTEDGLPAIAAAGHRVTGSGAVAGNRVDLLENGEQAFPAMLQAIAGAKQELLLMTYIFESDHVGQQFVNALRAANNRGVRTCVLVDDVGRRHNFPTIVPKLQQAGVEVRCFNPLRLLPPNLGINLRNHRKVLLVDQCVGFSGGMNIGARHLVSFPSSTQASDLCFRFQGPILASLRQVFCNDWHSVAGATLAQAAQQSVAVAGNNYCRVVTDGPDEELDNLTLTIIGVLSAAQQRIVLVTPYFLPNARIVGALQAAALRGVSVDVLVPLHCNWPMVRWALNHRINELLRVGIKFYEQPPPFAHSKCLLVDDDYALVGSANMDERSLRLNFELGIEIFGREFCKVLGNCVDLKLAASAPLMPSSLDDRSRAVKLRDSIFSLFAPYL